MLSTENGCSWRRDARRDLRHIVFVSGKCKPLVHFFEVARALTAYGLVPWPMIERPSMVAGLLNHEETGNENSAG